MSRYYPGGRDGSYGPLGNWVGGFFDLGPPHIPPIQPAVGMTDRAGTGQVWYLFWDGVDHLILTDTLPTSAQNVYTFQPYDGPYIGQTGWRLGVTTETQPLSHGPANSPHLVVDVPGTFEGSRWPSSAHPLIAPPVLGQTLWSVPESTGWPTAQPPTVPGIPSSSPVPTGGGYAAFEAAFASNTPVLVSSTSVTISSNVPQPWHLGMWGGPAQS
jgi:hypothetical protein